MIWRSIRQSPVLIKLLYSINHSRWNVHFSMHINERYVFDILGNLQIKSVARNFQSRKQLDFQ